MSRAAQVKLPQWTSNRATLIGDAAHATFGVGTSLAIQGAYFLAGELSKIKSTNDVPQALKSYEEVFRKVQGKHEDLPPGFPQIAFPQTTWGLRLRDSALWFVAKTKAYNLLPDEAEDDTVLPEYEWVEV